MEMTAWLKKARIRLRLFFKSIRFRLTLWTAAILVVILLVFSIFVYYRQAQYLTIDTRIQLQEQAQRLSPLYRFAGLVKKLAGSVTAPSTSCCKPGRPPHSTLWQSRMYLHRAAWPASA